ncbi:hypothetical protein D5S17_14275 [Pseudonocardiaceae bacterium YIM PH 21723]|nr:hypothetical protein D5S17_14275 [Pseudonocardiaceae bacterium YIM PH 21723]
MADTAAAASKAQEYASGKLVLGDGHQLFATVKKGHSAVVDALTESYKHLSNLLAASAGELVKTADVYQSIDQAHAEQLDSIYPK